MKRKTNIKKITKNLVKTSEELMASSDIIYKDLFENITVGLCRTTPGPDGTFLDVNPAMLKMLDADNIDQLLAHHPSEIYFDPQERKIVSDAIVSKGTIKGMEVRYRTLKGRVIWCRISSKKKISPDGQVFFNNTFEDITERKNAADAVKESQARLQSVLDDSQDVILRFNLQTDKYEFFSLACRAIYGYSPKEMLAMSFQENLANIHPEDLPKVMAEFNRLDETGLGYLENRWRIKSGEFRWLSTSLKIVNDASGRPLYRDAIVRDITQRKLAEEALQLKDFVFKASIAANIIADPKGNINEVNDAFLRLWGFPTKEEVLGKPFLNLIKDHAEALVIVTALDDIGRWDGDYTAKRKDGSTFIAHGMATNLRDSSGTFIGYQFAVLDVSLERKNERDLATYRDHLESLVAQRTALLEATNKELEAFVYSVSHDLRAPLRAIDGFSQAILEDYHDKLDETGKDHIARVRAATQRMGELIDDLLNLSRINRSDIKTQKVDFSELVRSVEKELRKIYPERHVESIIAPDVCVNGDPNLLRIVLENLIGNAWKFTSKKDNVRIEFGLQKKADSVIFFIRDNGAGFDMTFYDKLFVPFQRLHSVTDFPGTGIGLALVQRIVHKHKGRIWAEGVKDHGATFYFTLNEDNETEAKL